MANFSAERLSIAIPTIYEGEGLLSGTTCDKNGNPITGIECNVNIFDKETYQMIGQTKSNSTNGQWTLDNFAPKGLKVLAVFSYEGTYLGDKDIAGAEYLTYD